MFPRVTPCSDGSLCCNNDPQCCQDGKGIFLDEGGERISARATAATTSYPPLSGSLVRFTQTPSTISASISSMSTLLSPSTTESLPPTISPTETPAFSSGSENSMGLKVGLGLGIPLAVLITACAVYFLLRMRRDRRDDVAPALFQPDSAPTYVYSAYHGVPKPSRYPGHPAELMEQSAAEMSGHPHELRPRYELT